MPFVTVPGFGLMLKPENPTATSETGKALSRTVWALTVPDTDEASGARARVLWLGDEVFQTGAACAYCQQLGLVECPGLHIHAQQYAQRLARSQKDPSRKITITSHVIAPAVTRRAEVIEHVERVLAAKAPAPR